MKSNKSGPKNDKATAGMGMIGGAAAGAAAGSLIGPIGAAIGAVAGGAAGAKAATSPTVRAKVKQAASGVKKRVTNSSMAKKLTKAVSRVTTPSTNGRKSGATKKKPAAKRKSARR